MGKSSEKEGEVEKSAQTPNNSKRKYEVVQKIGKGTYGVVYKAKDVTNSKWVAMKKIKIEGEFNEGIPCTVVREISLLQSLRHDSIIKLLDVITEYPKNKIYLVFEYIETDLRGMLQSTDLSLKRIKVYLFQLLSAISYLHSQRILHRDLKPQNILVEQKDEKLVLIDFGLAKNSSNSANGDESTHTGEVVTLWYRAPEVLLGEEKYGPAVDIWSIGCIFAEFFLKEPLFPGENDLDQLTQIFKILGVPKNSVLLDLPKWKVWKFPPYDPIQLSQILPNIGSVGIDLLCRMFEFDPSKRISATQALRHPYFTGLSEKA